MRIKITINDCCCCRYYRVADVSAVRGDRSQKHLNQLMFVNLINFSFLPCKYIHICTFILHMSDFLFIFAVKVACEWCESICVTSGALGSSKQLEKWFHPWHMCEGVFEQHSNYCAFIMQIYVFMKYLLLAPQSRSDAADVISVLR